MESWEEEGLGLGLGSGGGEKERERDVAVIREAWRREKAAPEILEFEGAAVRRLREQIQLQEERMEEELEVGIGGKREREEEIGGKREKEKAEIGGKRDREKEDLVASLHHMDLDRALFLLKSYLRLRLRKIEKHMFFYASHPHLLSPQEQLFCRSCVDTTTRHLNHSLLANLPHHYQSLTRQSTSSEHDDMVDSPQLDTFVFCKTKTDVGAFQLDDTGEEIVDLVVDDLYVLRYKSIRGLVESGRIDLI